MMLIMAPEIKVMYSMLLPTERSKRMRKGTMAVEGVEYSIVKKMSIVMPKVTSRLMTRGDDQA